jgi:hypothetical protein
MTEPLGEMVARWEAVALPESADEYDEWRPMMVEAMKVAARSHKAAMDYAGKWLYLELAYRGEDAYAALRDELRESLDVSDRTLRRWRLLIEQAEGLPPASPRAASQQRAGTAIATRNRKAADQPERQPPPPAVRVRPDAVISPTPATVAEVAVRGPEQMSFTFETPSNLLVQVMASVPPDRHDELAGAIGAWLTKHANPPKPRGGDVTTMFKRKTADR